MSTPLVFSAVDKRYVHIPVTAALWDGGPATLTGIDVALLPRGSGLGKTTTWVSSVFAGGVAVALVAGPDADPTGALVVPRGGADVWIRDVDNPETVTALVGTIQLR